MSLQKDINLLVCMLRHLIYLTQFMKIFNSYKMVLSLKDVISKFNEIHV